ncbi:5-dehydro-4-deoxy-D-glucuronate isomerase [Exilibacterium tricleocarpae]|uniref:4-deoxy-L-threo-5-hexosulose-uronate ketol-isomerase n=1 Tax=Exilibacterium tricleocarpae TaxID=2591008 RepID=A0A545TNL9_9GAMM|nr:5-dehydro-4-deoxy-D-glucuronate isomerase [Exilibacterium tricleocarpae]TQV78823.1 5-dehydro-4-deoxy-D-glucuronate isomerase [Exilibacterium tricleocarpae]
MEVKYTVGKNEYARMSTEMLRETFLVTSLFKTGEISLVYSEVERAVIGSAVPAGAPLVLEAGDELAATHFCERRELGILNVGAEGSITVDGQKYPMANLDCLYVGRGAEAISFESDAADRPALFYLLSYPAHTGYPTTHASKEAANPIRLGSVEDSNKRTIYQYIHGNGIQSCQLVMGFTSLEEGSVWNTMPPHTHERRTEVYMYFNIAEGAGVFHFMGPPAETRHLMIGNGQAVVSPMWSIHSGCGTRAYSFCWGMGGENQVFDDMDGVAVTDLR